MPFTDDDIVSRLRAVPFVPVRVTTTAGNVYDINHPGLAIVTPRFLYVGVPTPRRPDRAETVTYIALDHIAELQDRPVPATPPG
jgi:hypothetical protein